MFSTMYTLTIFGALQLLWFPLFVSSEKEVPKAVAFYCGRPALYLTASGWLQDQSTDCLHKDRDIVSFCRIHYPDANITRASFSPVIEVPLQGWCHWASSNCSSEFTSTFRIQPWICTASKPAMVVPRGCQKREFGGPNYATCHKAEYWTEMSSQQCSHVQRIVHVKPCIKPGSYLHLHFLGALVACCDQHESVGLKGTAERVSSPPLLPPPMHLSIINHSIPSETSLTLSNVAMDDSLLIDRDSAIYLEYLDQTLASNKTPTEGEKGHEHQRYNAAKKAAHEAFNARKHILEQELVDAENQLTVEDWIRDPVHTQEAENRLHEEFRRKYVAINQEASKTAHELFLTHQQHTSQLMDRRFDAAASAWDKAVRTKPADLTKLFATVERLHHVLERNRYHLIRHWERLQLNDPLEAKNALAYLRARLIVMDRRFNQTLEKVDMVPLLKDAILHRVAQLRDQKYPQLDAMLQSLKHVNLPEFTGAQLTEQEAISQAETLISKHRHHLPKLDLDKRDGKSELKSVSPPVISGVIQIDEDPQVSSSFSTSNSSAPASSIKVENSQTATSTVDGVFSSQATASSSFHIATTLAPRTGDHKQHSYLLRSPGLTAASKWFISLTTITALLLVILFVMRYRIRRARLRRAGYSRTVAEVNEITAASTPNGDTLGDLREDEATRLTNWRLNGYENPAFKFPRNVVRFPRAQ